MLLRRQEHAGITAATGRNLPIAHGAPTCVGPRSKEPSMTITRRVTVHEGPGGRFESMAVFDDAAGAPRPGVLLRSEEHTSELQSLMRISYAVFCLKKTIIKTNNKNTRHDH